jgi:hypothetical chaperone protein
MRNRQSSAPIAYGIDFGTTNSSIAAAYRDRIDVVPVESGPLTEILPSIIYLNRDRNRAAGQEAIEQFLTTGAMKTQCGACDLVQFFGGQRETDCRQYKSGGNCHNARLIAGIKSDLSETDRVATHSWATDFTLPELVAVVLRRLKRDADRFTGSDVRRLVLGHPIVFVGAEGPRYHERQGAAEERIQEAARIAGFEEVVLFDEPSAALTGETLPEGVAVATDFGGGTFDVSVIRFGADGGDVLALAGAEIGGEKFDRALFDAKVGPALGLDREYEIRAGVHRPPPGWLRSRLGTLNGLRRLLSDSMTASTLSEYRRAPGGDILEPVDGILYGGYAYAFYSAIEQAKIALSTENFTRIDFQRPGIDLSIPVTRDEFEALIAKAMDAITDCITQALADAGVEPQQVSLVLRTGGSSSIPAFVRILEETFDPSVIRERPVYTTVVRGLAMNALEHWS